MPDQAQLKTFYVEAFRQLDKLRPTPEIDVKFFPYAGLRHTIRLRSGRIYARVSDIFESAPDDVNRALAFLLVAKLLRRRAPVAHERIYKEFACAPEVIRQSDLARRRRGRKVITTARGKTYDLERIFARINRRHFDNRIAAPTLTWSQRRTHRILGHHDSVHDTIVISKTLDSADFPEWFVEYIMFHEMLHIKHPARIVGGRRLYHTKTFRTDEKRFPRYEEAQRFLDRIAIARRAPHTRAA